MKLGWKNILVLFFILVGVIATYFITKGYGLKNIIGFYKNFDILLLLVYLIIISTIYATLTWRWDTILRSRGHKVPFHKLYIYRMIGASINFFTPGPRVGGAPTQASMLGKHGVQFTEGLSTIMIDKIIDITTCGLLFIIGVFLVGLRYALPHDAGVLLTIGAIVFLTLVILFYNQMLNDKHFFLHIFRFLRLDRTKNKSLKKIEDKIEEMELIMIQFYKHDKKTFMASIGISLLSWVAMFIEYKLATTLLGLNLGMIELFFIITFVGLAVLFPVPMAVGVLEAGQISAFSMINLAGSAGVALAFLVRMKDFFFGVIGIILLPIYGLDLKETIKHKYARNKK
ncbi:MAG: lysylphosphatidylglycerol synthase transmembrane domain-containing protein [Candidatus Woesearchaeota archaeon]